MNLIAIVRDTNCAVTKQILDYEPSESNNWNPTKVESKEDLNTLLAQKLQVNNCIAIQGLQELVKLIEWQRYLRNY